MGSLIRASNLRGFSPLVREVGGDPVALLARRGLPANIETDDDAFVAFRDLNLLLEDSAVSLSCPDFGLRLAAWQGLAILGPIAVVVRHSGTLLEGIEAIARYLHVHSPALSLRLEADGELLKVVYAMSEPGLGEMQQAYELSLANAVRILDLLAPGVRPVSVSFTHAQVGPDRGYRDALGCPVRFSQPWCGFLVPASLVDHQIDTADPETRRVARAYLDSYLAPGPGTSAQVAEIIRRLLPTGACTEDAVADQLALHPRTLQRRLAEEGHTYHDLREGVRREQALTYLTSPGLSLSQVAGLLGYAEQSALNRSCQRWFGQTPRQIRGSRTAQPSPGH